MVIEPQDMVYPVDIHSFTSIPNDPWNKDPNTPMLLAVVKAANPLEAFCLLVFTGNCVQNSMVCLCAWQIQSVSILSALKITKKYEEKCCSGSLFLKIGGGIETGERKKKWNVIPQSREHRLSTCTAE